MHGIDVSSNNVPTALKNATGGGIDWPALYQAIKALSAAAGDNAPPFVWIKVSEGISYVNPRWQWDRAGAHAAGFQVGLYHFDRASEASGAQQAAFFLTCVGNSSPGGPGGIWKGEALAGDWEDTNVSDGADLKAECLDFLTTLQRALGINPYRYTGLWYAQPHNLIGHPELQPFRLWWASYTDQEPPAPSACDPISIWQYSATGSLNGCDTAIDLDYFHGGLAEWNQCAWGYQQSPLAGQILDPKADISGDVPHILAKISQDADQLAASLADQAQKGLALTIKSDADQARTQMGLVGA